MDKQSTKWSALHGNPFAAIREIGKSNDIENVKQIFISSMEWDNFDHQHYLDDVLQEIAGKTNIVVQYLPGGYRAAYDIDSVAIKNTDDEVIVNLADGWTLRSSVYDKDAKDALTSGEYVRLCKPDGDEYAYWDKEEWRADPAIVMGAIINSAAGLRMDDSKSLRAA